MHQAQILSRLTGEERINQAFHSSDFVRQLAVDNIKKQNPKIKPPELIEKLKERLTYG